MRMCRQRPVNASDLLMELSGGLLIVLFWYIITHIDITRIDIMYVTRGGDTLPVVTSLIS